MENKFKFSEILISKLCHDLASPAGVIMNGIEFIEEDELENDIQYQTNSFNQKAMSLIKSNSSILIARIKFYRFLYGKLENIGEVDMKSVKEICNGYFADSNIHLIWESPISADNLMQITSEQARLILLSIAIAKTVLVYGGNIVISFTHEGEKKFAKINANAQKIKLKPEIESALLTDDDFEENLSLDNALIFLLKNKAKLLKAELKSEILEQEMNLSIEF